MHQKIWTFNSILDGSKYYGKKQGRRLRPGKIGRLSTIIRGRQTEWLVPV